MDKVGWEKIEKNRQRCKKSNKSKKYLILGKNGTG
jgi:hypothetical protein